MSPDDIGDVRVRAHRRGVKVWFDTEAPTKEHYEAQLLSRKYIDGKDGVALEIGFHTEHKEESKNEAVAKRLKSNEKSWRKELGKEPKIAPFFGSDNWRRVSESWIEPDLEDPEITFEIASRLVDYVTVIEPARAP